MLLLLFSRNDGAVVVPDVTASVGGGWLDPKQIKHLERLAKEAEHTRQREWAKSREKRARRLDELRATYERVNQTATQQERAALTAAVAPFVPAKAARGAAVDWTQLLGTADAVAQVSRALSQLLLERQEAMDLQDIQDLMGLAA